MYAVGMSAQLFGKREFLYVKKKKKKVMSPSSGSVFFSFFFICLKSKYESQTYFTACRSHHSNDLVAT